MKKVLLICLLFAGTAAMAQKDDAAKYAALITQKALKEKLTIVASAEMEGRETAMPGQKKATAYIESEFKKFGLKPGNGDSYQQVYPVYRDSISDKQLVVNGQTFTWDKDYSFILQLTTNNNFTFNNIVFAGYGIVDSASKTNDYEGLDVKGKIVLVLDGGMPAPNPNVRVRRGVNPTAVKVNAAKANGAVGILIVSQTFPKRTLLKGGLYVKLPSTFVAATVSDEVASALLGKSPKVAFAQLKEIPKGNYTSQLNLVAGITTEHLESSNVIGILPGTDKKDEYVFMTGHYDHLGKNATGIFYGADDDGSGTVTVLQMAEAFSAAAKKGKKPRRTIVFMTVSGEEKGLWGSEYYADHPIYPIEKTSVDLNTDMIGRVDTERKTEDSLNYIYVIGHDKLSSDLPIINEGVNNKYTHLVLDYKFDDPEDKNSIYYRSDHYNFAKKGIPILFFYDGMLLADYHKQTDTVDKINFELMEKRARMIFHTGWVMANRDDMLKRDTPLNMPSTR
jgi:hypothetical protein